MFFALWACILWCVDVEKGDISLYQDSRQGGQDDVNWSGVPRNQLLLASKDSPNSYIDKSRFD